ncbi:MAG: hypothetical protein AAF989_11575, partial [Planctomycetota bacterium]
LVKIAKYREDRKSTSPVHEADPIPFDTLVEHADRYLERMRSFHGRATIVMLNVLSVGYSMLGKNPFNVLNIRVADLDTLCRFSLNRGLERAEGIEFDIELGSQSLQYLLDNDWGSGTVSISGRYRIKSQMSNWKFRRVFQLGMLACRDVSLGKDPLFLFRKENRISEMEPVNMFKEGETI